MKKGIKYGILSLALLIITLFMISYSTKIETDYYCCESPTVRWKFAIYCGECDDETGCHFVKIENTGFLDYFGFKEIDCTKNN